MSLINLQACISSFSILLLFITLRQRSFKMFIFLLRVEAKRIEIFDIEVRNSMPE